MVDNIIKIRDACVDVSEDEDEKAGRVVGQSPHHGCERDTDDNNFRLYDDYDPEHPDTNIAAATTTIGPTPNTPILDGITVARHITVQIFNKSVCPDYYALLFPPLNEVVGIWIVDEHMPVECEMPQEMCGALLASLVLMDSEHTYLVLCDDRQHRRDLIHVLRSTIALHYAIGNGANHRVSVHGLCQSINCPHVKVCSTSFCVGCNQIGVPAQVMHTRALVVGSGMPDLLAQYTHRCNNHTREPSGMHQSVYKSGAPLIQSPYNNRYTPYHCYPLPSSSSSSLSRSRYTQNRDVQNRDVQDRDRQHGLPQQRPCRTSRPTTGKYDSRRQIRR